MTKSHMWRGMLYQDFRHIMELFVGKIGRILFISNLHFLGERRKFYASVHFMNLRYKLHFMNSRYKLHFMNLRYNMNLSSVTV